jgi:hypothetical protein
MAQQKNRRGGIPISSTEVEVICPIGVKDHKAHDMRINLLEEFRKNVERTPRVLAIRVIKLERAIRILQRQLSEAKR